MGNVLCAVQCTLNIAIIQERFCSCFNFNCCVTRQINLRASFVSVITIIDFLINNQLRIYCLDLSSQLRASAPNTLTINRSLF